MTDTTDKLTMQAETRGVQQATDELNKFAGAVGGVGVQSEKTERSTTSLDNKFAALERRFGTAGGRAAQFERIQNLVNRAVEQGSVSQERANAVLAAAEQKYGGVSTVLQRQRDQLEQLASIQKTVNNYAGISLPGGDSSGRAADIAAYGKQLDDLRAKYNPVFAAGRQYRDTLAEINQAAKVGALTEAERAAAITSTKSAFTEQISVLRNVKSATTEATTATGLARHELVNLSRQAQDVAVSLGSGQSFGTVLLQQGTQIADVFANSQGSVKGFFGQIVSGAASVLTPMRLVAGGMAGISLGAIAAAASWQSSQNDIQKALVGIGRQSGVTVSDINAIGQATSNTTKLSIGQAAELATAFAATGRISKEAIGSATAATDGLAKALGVDAADAAKLLAGALADPSKGVADLDAKVGAFNATTREQIAQAIRMGDVGQAQALMIQGVTVATQGATEANKSWSDSFANLWKDIKNGTGLLGGDLVKGIQLVRHDLGGAVPTSGVSKQDQLAIAQADLASLQSLPTAGLDAGSLQAYNEQLKALTDQVARLKSELQSQDIAAWNAQLDRAATAADNATKAMVQQIDQVHQLEQAVSDLTRAQNVLGAQGAFRADYSAALTAAENQLKITRETKEEAAAYNEYVRQVAAAYPELTTKAALAAEQSRGQLEMAKAYTGQQQMQIQFQTTFNQIFAQTKNEAVALQTAQAQYAEAQARVDASIQKQTEALKDQVTMIRAQANGTEATAAAAITYKNAIEAGASETKAAALAAETMSVYLERSAVNAERMAQAAARAVDAANEARYIQASGQSGMVAGGDTGSYQQQGSFSASNSFGFQSAGGGSFTYDPLGPTLRADNDRLLNQTQQGVANAAYANGGIDAAIAAAQGYRPYAATGPYGQAQPVPVDASQLYSQVDQLYQLKNQQTNDPAQQAANLREELAYLQSQPASIERDQMIIRVNQQLIQALKDNTDATNANTQVTLNPFYTQGHSAVPQFGYYKAASGMDEIVSGGTPGVDSVPYHLMLMPGERLRVDPVGKVSNDNNGLASILQAVRAAATTVQNNFFDLRGISTSNARRSRRQFAQGFGQASAAMSR